MSAPNDNHFSDDDYTFGQQTFEMLMETSSSSESEVEEEEMVAYLISRRANRDNPTSSRTRRYTRRDRADGGIRLYKDYFCENPVYNPDVFRRRFRMRRPLFERILWAVHAHDPYFQQQTLVTGEMGLTPYQKVTAAIRLLANGTAADSVDEYIRIAESTTYVCLEHFCNAVVQIFAPHYLREPNAQDMARLLAENESRGFPGMIGSVDCMHWRWKNCPKAWAGSYTGYKGHPTIILEAVASHDLHFWHIFFGMPGSYNDINVINRSGIFDRMMRGESPPVEYVVNGTTYSRPYYLGDGIYPKLATIVKTLPAPRTRKERNFAAAQESARKDVERAFGVFQARWAIIRQPARTWRKELMHSIMVACVVLHNMIVEDEPQLDASTLDKAIRDNTIEDDICDQTHVAIPPVRRVRNSVGRYQHVVEEYAKIHDEAAHFQLRADLIEHLWSHRGATD